MFLSITVSLINLLLVLLAIVVYRTQLVPRPLLEMSTLPNEAPIAHMCPRHTSPLYGPFGTHFNAQTLASLHPTLMQQN